MATFFRNKVIKEIGTSPVEVLRLNQNTRATVIGMSITNLIEENVLASVLVEDDASTTGFYIKDTLIPVNSTLKALNGGEKLIIAPENALFISSNQESSIDLILSYVEVV